MSFSVGGFRLDDAEPAPPLRRASARGYLEGQREVLGWA
jgi:hypothetical protein